MSDAQRHNVIPPWHHLDACNTSPAGAANHRHIA
jgi:hypothetical protein